MELEEKKQAEHDSSAHDADSPGKDKKDKSKLKHMRSHLLCGKTWLRIVFIVFFILLYYIAKVIAAAVVVLQMLFILFTGRKNLPIAEFSAGLALYIYQIAQYVFYLCDDKPFPFQSWPKADLPKVDEGEQLAKDAAQNVVSEDEKPSENKFE